MKRMHALPQLAGVPVIMMSGRDPEKYRDEALAAGASAYLTKPFETDALVVAIRVALGEDVGLAAATTEEGAVSGRLGDILKDMGLVTDEQIASALARQSEVASASAAFAGKVVLLVDDDEDLLVALAAPLRRQGFDVAVATDAVTAISTAVKQPPDVVIMDIGLPGRRRHDGDAAAALAAAAGRRAGDHAQRTRPRASTVTTRSPPAPSPTSPSRSTPEALTAAVVEALRRTRHRLARLEHAPDGSARAWGAEARHGRVDALVPGGGPCRRQWRGDLTASTSAERAPRTLFVTNDFPPRIGGAQSYYWGVIRTLDPSEVAILAPAHIDAAAFDATHPYTVVRASTSVLWPTNAMLHTVEQMAEREGAELIQLGHPLPAGLLGPRLRQRRGLPYVVFLGGAEVTLPGVVPGVNNMLRHVLGNASMLLTVSEYTAEAARKQTSGKVPAEVLRPPLLVEDFVPADRDEAARLRERLGIDGQIVVCVGRLIPRKGQDKLIDALALLRSEFPRLHLVLIGEGRLATGLYDRAQKRGVGERVHLTGALADKAMKEWLRAADVFASPCRSRWARPRGGGLRHRVRRGRARRPAGDRRRLRRRARGRRPGRHRPRRRRPLGPAGRRRAGVDPAPDAGAAPRHGRQGTRARAGAPHAGGRRRALPRAAAQGGGK